MNTYYKEYIRLRGEADTLWGKRDALIDERYDLSMRQTVDVDAIIRLDAEIQLLGDAAIIVEMRASEIYNAPETWDDELGRNVIVSGGEVLELGNQTGYDDIPF